MAHKDRMMHGIQSSETITEKYSTEQEFRHFKVEYAGYLAYSAYSCIIVTTFACRGCLAASQSALNGAYEPYDAWHSII